MVDCYVLYLFWVFYACPVWFVYFITLCFSIVGCLHLRLSVLAFCLTRTTDMCALADACKQKLDRNDKQRRNTHKCICVIVRLHCLSVYVCFFFHACVCSYLSLHCVVPFQLNHRTNKLAAINTRSLGRGHQRQSLNDSRSRSRFSFVFVFFHVFFFQRSFDMCEWKTTLRNVRKWRANDRNSTMVTTTTTTTNATK